MNITYQLQHKCLVETPINHRRKAHEATIDLLSTIQDAVNQAIKDGAERVELRYLNILDEIINPHGNIGMVRVLAYRAVAVATSDTSIPSQQSS